MKALIQRWLEIPGTYPPWSKQDTIASLEGHIAMLERKIENLEGNILALNGGHKPNKRCDAKYSPLANVYAVCNDCGWQVGFHKIAFDTGAA